MFDLARASVLSVILFLATGFAATTPNSRITISFQAVHASQGGGIYDRGEAVVQPQVNDLWPIFGVQSRPVGYTGSRLAN
jgi:hypothetical protein